MTMEEEKVILQKLDETALVKLNRPPNLNALNTSLTQRLLEIILTLEKDPEIKSVVITGEGKGFCAGGDVKEFYQQEERWGYIMDLAGILHQCISSIRRMPKPVIAAVNGVASGAGMSLVLACDLAVADEKASFNMAYIRIAASPDGGSSLILSRTLGLKRASELIFSGHMVGAQEALELGLINRVAPHGKALDVALEMARELNQGPPLAMAACKALINQALFPDLECHLEAERRSISHLGTTQDFQEGLTAFFEKRKPNFKGA